MYTLVSIILKKFPECLLIEMPQMLVGFPVVPFQKPVFTKVMTPRHRNEYIIALQLFDNIDFVKMLQAIKKTDDIIMAIIHGVCFYQTGR